MNFINSIAKNSNFAFSSANFWWIFFRISRQIPEKSDVCRIFNRICENKLENCRIFWNLWKLFKIIQTDPNSILFIIIHYYSYYSLLFIRVLSRKCLAVHEAEALLRPGNRHLRSAPASSFSGRAPWLRPARSTTLLQNSTNCQFCHCMSLFNNLFTTLKRFNVLK